MTCYQYNSESLTLPKCDGKYSSNSGRTTPWPRRNLINFGRRAVASRTLNEHFLSWPHYGRDGRPPEGDSFSADYSCLVALSLMVAESLPFGSNSKKGATVQLRLTEWRAIFHHVRTLGSSYLSVR